MVQKWQWEPADALRKQKQKTETVQKQASKHATHKKKAREKTCLMLWKGMILFAIRASHGTCVYIDLLMCTYLFVLSVYHTNTLKINSKNNLNCIMNHCDLYATVVSILFAGHKNLAWKRLQCLWRKYMYHTDTQPKTSIAFQHLKRAKPKQICKTIHMCVNAL